jgi:hypothetical protein
VIPGGGSVGVVAIEFGNVEDDPSNGTSTVPGAVGDDPAIDDAVESVVEVFADPRFVEGVVDDSLVEGEDEAVSESPDDCVVGGPAVTRLAPPEHATAVIVNANAPTTVQTLRLPGYAMRAAYPGREHAIPDLNLQPGRAREELRPDEEVGKAVEVPAGGAEQVLVGGRAPQVEM